MTATVECPGCPDPHSDGRCCRCGRDEHAARTVRISKTQQAELEHVVRAHPDGVDERDRHPELFLRMVSRRSTVAALQRLGLCEEPYRDWPDGWHARLTPAGIEERRRLRAARAELRRAIRRMVTA